MTTVLAAPGLPDRLGLILAGLRRDLAMRAARDRALAALVLVLLLWNRLSRLSARFAALAARQRAGASRARPKPSPRRAGPSPDRPPRDRPPPPRDRLPRHRGWLLRHVPECASHAEHLRLLLAEPEMAALIEQVPQVRRLLRPLWRMLHPEPPPEVLRSPLPPKGTPPNGTPRKPRLRRGRQHHPPRPAHRAPRAVPSSVPPPLKRG